MFKNYIKYLQNNPEHYWFKRKLYGWGWTPVRWQGWVAILAYITGLVILSRVVNQQSVPSDIIFYFLIPAFVWTIALITLCYKTGEQPKWQWGPEKPEDKK